MFSFLNNFVSDELGYKEKKSRYFKTKQNGCHLWYSLFDPVNYFSNHLPNSCSRKTPGLMLQRQRIAKDSYSLNSGYVQMQMVILPFIAEEKPYSL